MDDPWILAGREQQNIHGLAGVDPTDVDPTLEDFFVGSEIPIFA